MSAKEYHIVPSIRPVIWPRVNGLVICNCKCTAFTVGIETDPVGNNHIRCLECIQCKHKLAVPFFHDATVS